MRTALLVPYRTRTICNASRAVLPAARCLPAVWQHHWHPRMPGVVCMQLIGSLPLPHAASLQFGNTIGDLPAYDAFLLGGPHSGEHFSWSGCHWRLTNGSLPCMAGLPSTTQHFHLSEGPRKLHVPCLC